MKKRESFNSQWGFILACIGSAVGMGNIWMFPTRVSLYGGGSFLIPYCIFVILIGFTGVIGEMCLGRGTRSGPIDAFGTACETKGNRKLGEILGWIPVLGALAMAIGYTVVMGWILKYMVGTFTGSTLSAENIDGFTESFSTMASAGRVGFFDTLAALLAALVIIPAMATTGAQLDQGGPGLLFIFLPHLIRSMPGGWLIAILFFTAVFLAGMTSLMNLYEAPVATVQEKTGLGRKASCAIIAGIGMIVSLLIQGIVSDWMDVLSIYICPLGAGLAGIMFFWVFGRSYVESQVNKGRETPFIKMFYPVCKYIYVPVCFLVLILGIALGGIG